MKEFLLGCFKAYLSTKKPGHFGVLDITSLLDIFARVLNTDTRRWQANLCSILL